MQILLRIVQVQVIRTIHEADLPVPGRDYVLDASALLVSLFSSRPHLLRPASGILTIKSINQPAWDPPGEMTTSRSADKKQRRRSALDKMLPRRERDGREGGSSSLVTSVDEESDDNSLSALSPWHASFERPHDATPLPPLERNGVCSFIQRRQTEGVTQLRSNRPASPSASASASAAVSTSLRVRARVLSSERRANAHSRASARASAHASTTTSAEIDAQSQPRRFATWGASTAAARQRTRARSLPDAERELWSDARRAQDAFTRALKSARDPRALGRVLRALGVTVPMNSGGEAARIRAALWQAADVAVGRGCMSGDDDEGWSALGYAVAVAAACVAAHGRIGVDVRRLWRKRGRKLSVVLYCQGAAASARLVISQRNAQTAPTPIQIAWNGGSAVPITPMARRAQARLLRCLRTSWNGAVQIRPQLLYDG